MPPRSQLVSRQLILPPPSNPTKESRPNSGRVGRVGWGGGISPSPRRKDGGRGPVPSSLLPLPGTGLLGAPLQLLSQQVVGRGLELGPRQKLKPSSPPSNPPGHPHFSRLSLGPSWPPLSRQSRPPIDPALRPSLWPPRLPAPASVEPGQLPSLLRRLLPPPTRPLQSPARASVDPAGTPCPPPRPPQTALGHHPPLGSLRSHPRPRRPRWDSPPPPPRHRRPRWEPPPAPADRARPPPSPRPPAPPEAS